MLVWQGFSYPEESQNPDLSYMTDLDLWDCLGSYSRTTKDWFRYLVSLLKKKPPHSEISVVYLKWTLQSFGKVHFVLGGAIL